jgi:hypothetical protein
MKKQFNTPKCQLLILDSEEVMTLNSGEKATWDNPQDVSSWFETEAAE